MSKTIGQRIREAREAHKWTQDDLAAKLGVTRTAITMWEADDSAPRAQRIGEVAKLLGLKPTDLIP